jgi:oxaloacetate decarboxylase gamma subunit
MLVGMGTVFVFLTLLVAATRVMSALVLRYFPAQAVAGKAGPAATAIPEEEIAAISIALAEHLQKTKGSDQ